MARSQSVDRPSRDQLSTGLLRNSLLTYYEDELKAPAFQKVVHSLTQGGFLAIGAHEKIPPGVRGLLPFGRHPCIFQKDIAMMENKMQSNCRRRNRTDTALDKIEEAIRAVELCEGELTPAEYKELRGRLGHLMDTLYKVGGALSKST